LSGTRGGWLSSPLSFTERTKRRPPISEDAITHLDAANDIIHDALAVQPVK